MNIERLIALHARLDRAIEFAVSRQGDNTLLINHPTGAQAMVSGAGKWGRLVGSREYIVDALYTPPKHRGKGVASEVLKILTDHADRRGKSVRLIPGRLFAHGRDRGLTDKALKGFYSRRGFVETPSGWFVRPPRKLEFAHEAMKSYK